MSGSRLLLALLGLLSCTAGCAPFVIYDTVQLQSEMKEARAAGTLPPAKLGWECQQEATTRRSDGKWDYDLTRHQACFARHGWVLVEPQPPRGSPLLSQIPVYKYVGGDSPPR
jgi:hypothetical protein